MWPKGESRMRSGAMVSLGGFGAEGRQQWEIDASIYSQADYFDGLRDSDIMPATSIPMPLALQFPSRSASSFTEIGKHSTRLVDGAKAESLNFKSACDC